MARATKNEGAKGSRQKAWLKIADDVKRHPGTAGRNQHAPSPDASAERVHELAGTIPLCGPVPNWRFLQDDDAG